MCPSKPIMVITLDKIHAIAKVITIKIIFYIQYT